MATQFPNSVPTLSFSLDHSSSSTFGPRTGKLTLERPENNEKIDVSTPGILTATSRGIVPHLSRDHHNLTQAIRWINVPFETFLEHNPPVPTLQKGENPLHKFLGYSSSRHILSMCVRDPFDGREMPPNGNDSISVFCVRGVRKITQSEWRSYVLACRPDVVVALADTPLTKPPYSQKRLTKSVERSLAWLADILRPIGHEPHQPLNILVPMVGGSSLPARRAFSTALIETLYDREAENIAPLKCLDEGVTGYTFDLVPLRLSLESNRGTGTSPDESLDSGNTATPATMPSPTSYLIPLMQASLQTLPQQKVRLANSAISPHEILRLIQHVGIDLFDAHWAQRAADIGIALDFRFPVSASSVPSAPEGPVKAPRIRTNGKRDLGHNLFDTIYTHDFSRLAADFLEGASAVDNDTILVCLCVACSPLPLSTRLAHSSIDLRPAPAETDFMPPYTRAYLHHLLLTHEMSGMSLLVMHNLAVFEAFFVGVRNVLALPDGLSHFAIEVEKFISVYDENMLVFDETRESWTQVELSRGKGRLAREKAKQAQANLGTAVEL